MLDQGRKIRKKYVKVMIVLLISLGSNIPHRANQLSNGPTYNILKEHQLRSYKITDLLSCTIGTNGYIRLQLSNSDFALDVNNNINSMQHIQDLPNLNSNVWTKEWKATDLPIFCKAEHYIQQKSGIAFRFRLGSLDYVNALEGK